MNTQKPSLQQFQEQIEAVFGQPLNSAANLAAKDFWANWAEFYEGISKYSISINVDMLFLSRNFPEYSRYHIWKGLALITFLVGIILFFFYWPAGIFLLLAGVGCNFYSKFKKVADGKKFIEDLKKEVIQNPFSKGMAKLCVYYIAGIIQLASANGQAHWPQYPSDAITGDKNFIPTMK